MSCLSADTVPPHRSSNSRGSCSTTDALPKYVVRSYVLSSSRRSSPPRLNCSSDSTAALSGARSLSANYLPTAMPNRCDGWGADAAPPSAGPGVLAAAVVPASTAAASSAARWLHSWMLCVHEP